MWTWWKQKRIDIFIAAVIIPSIILSVLALWTLSRQYEIINYILKTSPASLPEANWLDSLSRIGIFSFSMIVFALLLILVIGGYLSSRDIQRQLELTRLKNDFVSTVSHELKTPLTSIRLLAERLVKLPPEESTKQKEYHSLILEQSYHLSHLIENILDFSKLEEGKQEYKFEKMDLTGLIKEAIENYPIKVIRPDCTLELNLANDAPLFYLDKEALSRAFINILDNALKFSPPGGIIKVGVRKINDEVFIDVADQGSGISEEEKKKIFEPFYHTGKGTGLGLTLARHIVQGHNGRVEFESQKGKGSNFKIILPLNRKEINVT